MILTMLLIFIAVVLSLAVFTGRGRLMSTENIKKEKIPVYRKGLRIFYGVLYVIVLVMAFFNFVEKEAYEQTHYYEFTEEYQGADGQLHAAGEVHTVAEMQQILVPTEGGGSLCAPTSGDPLPYRYSNSTYALKERYASSTFLSSIPYQTAHILNFVCLGLCMAVIIALFVFINKMTDQEAKRKNSQEGKRAPVRPSMPKGAFDFSDYQDEVEVKDAMFDDVQQEAPTKK